jgi:hypothetical protein
MDLGPLRALVLDLNFNAHGVNGTLTLPNEDPVDTRLIWLANDTEQVPRNGGFGRAEPRRVLALRRDLVPAIPIGSRIVAPELSTGSDKVWKVDGMDRYDADHHRVIVVLDQTATADLPDEP